MQSRNIEYIPAVDHLRGFAALLIVAYHGVSLIAYELKYARPFAFDHWLEASNPLQALLFEGHTAVSLFMVLSGFIFTVGVYRARVVYRDFIFNRFVRTYPLFLFFLLLGILFYSERASLTAIGQSLFFLGNYPGAFQGGSFTAMFWAVAVEWQFYWLYPLIMLAVNRLGPALLLLLIAAALLLRVMMLQAGGELYQMTYLSLVGRMDQFLIGILAGVIYRDYFKFGRTWDFLSLISFILICWALYLFNQGGGWPGFRAGRAYWPLIEACLWGVFILAYISLSRHWPALIDRALRQIGVVSYSIYLGHFVLIDFLINHQFLLPWFSDRPVISAGVTTLIVVMPATLCIAVMLYTLIEKPFLLMRKSYKRRIQNS